MLRTSIDKIKENGFKLTKERRRRYPAKTVTDADYADDTALLANASDQAETQLHSLERAAAGLGLHVNVHKTDYTFFNQTGNISTLNGGSLKVVDKLTYQRSSVSWTKTDINTRLAMAWTANDRLSYGSQTWLIKLNAVFFPSSGGPILLHQCTTWTLTERTEKKLDSNYTKCCEQYWTSPGGSTPQSSSCTATYRPSRKLSKLDAPDMRDTAGEVITMCSCVLLHINGQRQDDQLEPTYSSFEPIRDVALEDLPEAMDDWEEWRERIKEIRADGVTSWWRWWNCCWWYNRKEQWNVHQKSLA